MNAQKFLGKDKGWKFLSKIWELMIDGVVMSPRKYKKMRKRKCSSVYKVLMKWPNFFGEENRIEFFTRNWELGIKRIGMSPSKTGYRNGWILLPYIRFCQKG